MNQPVKLLCISAVLTVLFANAGLAHPYQQWTTPQSSQGPTRPGDHYVPGHYIQPKYVQPRTVQPYVRKDGQFVNGYNVEGGYRDGHYKDGHWVHSRKKSY